MMHLVTAANGAEEFYGTATNAVRMETPEVRNPHLARGGGTGLVEFSIKPPPPTRRPITPPPPKYPNDSLINEVVGRV